MNGPEYFVRLLKAAEEDFTDIVDYVADDRPSAADLLATRIEDALNHLSANPKLGRVPREEYLTQMNYRCVIVEDYLIFYKIDGRTVLIHRILHGARDYVGLL